MKPERVKFILSTISMILVLISYILLAFYTDWQLMLAILLLHWSIMLDAHIRNK